MRNVTSPPQADVAVLGLFFGGFCADFARRVAHYTTAAHQHCPCGGRRRTPAGAARVPPPPPRTAPEISRLASLALPQPADARVESLLLPRGAGGDAGGGWGAAPLLPPALSADELDVALARAHDEGRRSAELR